MSFPRKPNPTTRREALRRVGNGFGMAAFASLLNTSMARAGGLPAPGGTGAIQLDHPQKVKRVIFLFMNGGLSTIDSFDPTQAAAAAAKEKAKEVFARAGKFFGNDNKK